MSQSRRASLVESVANLVVGYAISVALTYWIFDITPAMASGVSLVYTIASVTRQYVLRRVFARVT